MAKFNQDLPQFGSPKPANTGGSQHCAQCEAMLADVLDGVLSVAEQAQFDTHVALCESCSQMLADAQRGAAWLELLRSPRPEPPADLLDRILAQTSNAASPQHLGNLFVLPVAGTAVSMPGMLSDGVAALPVRPGVVLPFYRRMAAGLTLKSIGQTFLQPRLAMTAAMAFFSIGLTLNLTGVRLNELHARDLKPSSVKRSFYQANAHVVRYVDNLRAVYELESRVRDLQRSSDNDAPATPPSQGDKQPATGGKSGPQNSQPDGKQPRPRTGSGTSRRILPADPIRVASLRSPDPAVSPLLGLVSISAMTSSTLQEGESV